uniref:Uncharacterized protein n=1 Tax=Arundo donax TaxID=35708 RepID=A0A0A9JSW5_ARUDO
MLWVGFCLKLLSRPALPIIFPMECFPLESKPFLPLLAFPTGVKVGYPISRFCSGIISTESLLELEDDTNDNRNALKEDVSGPL